MGVKIKYNVKITGNILEKPILCRREPYLFSATIELHTIK